MTELEAHWSLVGFTGIGDVEDSFSGLFGSRENSSKHTVGGGLRYLLARRLGLQAGVMLRNGRRILFSTSLSAVPGINPDCS